MSCSFDVVRTCIQRTLEFHLLKVFSFGTSDERRVKVTGLCMLPFLDSLHEQGHLLSFRRMTAATPKQMVLFASTDTAAKLKRIYLEFASAVDFLNELKIMVVSIKAQFRPNVYLNLV